MALAVLERIDAWMSDSALKPLKGHGAPQTRLRAMLRTLDEFYAGGRNARVLGTLVIDGSRAKFQQYLKSAFGDWVEAVRELAMEAGIKGADARHRAEDAVVRIEGARIVAAPLNDLAPFRRALRNIERDLLT